MHVDHVRRSTRSPKSWERDMIRGSSGIGRSDFLRERIDGETGY